MGAHRFGTGWQAEPVRQLPVGGKWADDKNGQSRYGDGKDEVAQPSYPPGRKDISAPARTTGRRSTPAPRWRLGANQTTKLTTEVPLTIGGKTIAAGTYDLFVELKEGAWTLIVSTQPTQAKYDPKDKTAIWGSYGYDPKFDVARAPMTVSRPPHTVDQLTIAFLDMTDAGGKLAVAWDDQAATADFTVGH